MKIVILLLLVSLNSMLYSSQPDQRIAGILKKKDIKFSVNDSGDFKLLFNVGNNRSQFCTINSNTSRYRDVEIREIWSIAYSNKTGLPYSVALKLLDDNGKKKLGNWVVVKTDEKYVVYFSIKLAANADEDELISAVILCLEAADELEEELMGSDDY